MRPGFPLPRRQQAAAGAGAAAAGLPRARAGLLWLPAVAGLILILHLAGWLLPTLRFLEPWEPSASVLLACAGAALLYGAGLRRRARAGLRSGFWRPLAFFLGLGLSYLMLQSQFDYIAQHMFWIHRLQHMILHHLAPLLLVLSAPLPVMGQALTPRARRWAAQLFANPVLLALYRVVQQPAVAALLFVGLIYLWLQPDVHYDAMLSLPLYKAMNWSMLLDGLLFWAVVFDPHPRHRARPSYGVRILMLWLIMIPQIALGAYIALHGTEIYDVYDVCGRVWATDPLLDQRIGGLIIWIPSSMMSVVAALIVMGMWRRDQRRSRADLPLG